MKKLLLLATVIALLPTLAQAQSQRNPCVYLGTTIGSCIPVGTGLGVGTTPMPVGGIANAAAPTFVEGKPGQLSFDLSGNLRVGGTFTPSGTQNVNLSQILSAAPSATNPLWVSPATGATFPISAAAGTLLDVVAFQAPVAPATATATKSILGGCQATSAAINPTTGQQAACSSDLNNNILISSGGSPNLTANARVSVTSSTTSVASARALRRVITITNITGSAAIDCAGGATATTATGQYIPAAVGANWTTSTTAQVSCISEGATQTVSVSEIY